MTPSNPFDAPADDRSAWDRLTATHRTPQGAVPTPASPALADGERLPRHVRQEAQQAARSYGVAIHVYRMKGGQYKGITADDPANLARFGEIASLVTIVPPPKGAAGGSPIESIPLTVWEHAERGAAKLGRAIVVFLTRSGEFRGITEDDETMLARYRVRARELGTVPPPLLPQPSPHAEKSKLKTSAGTQVPVVKEPRRANKPPQPRTAKPKKLAPSVTPTVEVMPEVMATPQRTASKPKLRTRTPAHETNPSPSPVLPEERKPTRRAVSPRTRKESPAITVMPSPEREELPTPLPVDAEDRDVSREDYVEIKGLMKDALEKMERGMV